jgi:parallel beta-helix repeat protein
LNDSDGSEVKENRIHADKTGIDVYDSSNVKLEGNKISGNAWDDGHHENHDSLAAKNGNGGYGSYGTVGINANKAANIVVDDNDIKNEDTGIKLQDSANAKVTWNTASNVTNGTVGNNADNLVYDHNTMNGRSTTKGDGLLLTDSSNAHVTNNKHTAFKNKLRLVNSNITLKSNNNF